MVSKKTPSNSQIGIQLLILDVERALSVSELGELARGVIIASLLISMIAALFLFSFKRIAGGETQAQKSTQLIRVVANASLITGILAVFIGLFATYLNQSTLKGSQFVGIFATGLGLWLIFILLFQFLAILLINKPRKSAATVGVKNPLTVSLLLVLTASLLLPLELPRPSRNVEAVGKTTSGVTVTVVMSPGAAGSNTMKLGLTGADFEVAKVFSYVIDGKAQISLTTGESDSDNQPIKLKMNEEGSLVAEEVIAKFSGKSKIRFKWSKSENPLTMPINLQENPGYNP